MAEFIRSLHVLRIGAGMLRTRQSCIRRLHTRSLVNSAADLAKESLHDQFGPVGEQDMVPKSGPLVIVLSGPSGVGKDAVIKSLKECRPDLKFVVTATSRAMRPGEIHGEDYFFVSKETFEEWLVQGNLLEYAVVYGEYKGIPRSEIDLALASGADVVLRVDIQGAKTIRRIMPNSVSIFLVAKSEGELVRRLTARKTESKDKLLLRVQTAREECRHIVDFDYVVENLEGQLAATVDAISTIIEAERLKVNRRLQSKELPIT